MILSLRLIAVRRVTKRDTKMGAVRNTHPQRSESFRGLKILVIMVGAMRTILFITVIRMAVVSWESVMVV
jgi:hypothetical protein